MDDWLGEYLFGSQGAEPQHGMVVWFLVEVEQINELRVSSTARDQKTVALPSFCVLSWYDPKPGKWLAEHGPRLIPVEFWLLVHEWRKVRGG